MAWFQRDYTGRALRPAERDFVAALSRQLAEVRAPQIDEGQTALTAEGDHCLIVLLPHRQLGGVSVVVWLFADRAEVTWAQVAGLDCCHDSLDLGISVAHFDLSAARPDFEPLLDCIRGQVNEPLTIRCFGVDEATILVRDDGGKLRKVGWIGHRAVWRVWQRRLPTREAVIRLSDTDPPPVTAPSGVDDWSGTDGGGAFAAMATLAVGIAIGIATGPGIGTALAGRKSEIFRRRRSRGQS